MRNVTLLGKLPLITSQWQEFDQYKKDIIDLCLKLEIPNTVESDVAVGAKSNLWESKFNFLESQEALQPLKMWLFQELTELINSFNNSNYRAVITESWCHVTRNGGYHKPHHHSNSTWSGIFYIDQDLDKGGSNNWYLPYYIERKAGLEFADDRCTASFVPGGLVLFPSMMMHDADTYYGDNPRIVIAFNIICL